MIKKTAILLFLPLTLLGQDFEEPPILSAAAILKPEFRTGVRNTVPTYRGRNGYLIDSDFGTFEADGNTMLVRASARSLPSGACEKSHAPTNIKMHSLLQ